MPPKKTKAKRAGKAGESSKGAKVAAAGNQGASRGIARVNLLTENVVRLRRLLLNTRGSNQSTSQAEESLTEGQRRQAAKRLKIYTITLLLKDLPPPNVKLRFPSFPWYTHSLLPLVQFNF